MFTHQDLNDMLQWGIQTLKKLNIPISESICPMVELAKTHTHYGQCCRRGNRRNKTQYDFLIRISAYTLGNTEKSLRNTILHELLHTIPGGHGHKGVWAKYASLVNHELGYHIQRIAGDKTDEDRANLRGNVQERRKSHATYIIVCPDCGARWVRHRRSALVNHPEQWACRRCGVRLVRKWD